MIDLKRVLDVMPDATARNSSSGMFEIFDLFFVAYAIYPTSHWFAEIKINPFRHWASLHAPI